MSMKSAGTPRRSSRGKIISLTIIAIGAAKGFYVEHRISIRPSTDDATIDADVVHVAAAVGGRIIELPVTENAKVLKLDRCPHDKARELWHVAEAPQNDRMHLWLGQAAWHDAQG
jgi:hypothetical protein